MEQHRVKHKVHRKHKISFLVWRKQVTNRIKMTRLWCEVRDRGLRERRERGVIDVIVWGERQPCQQTNRERWTLCLRIKQAGRKWEVRVLERHLDILYFNLFYSCLPHIQCIWQPLALKLWDEYSLAKCEDNSWNQKGGSLYSDRAKSGWWRQFTEAPNHVTSVT